MSNVTAAVTKIRFCGDHDDLARLQIQLYEVLASVHYLAAYGLLKCAAGGCNKGAALMVLTQHLGLNCAARLQAFCDAK